jgi:hypothetical protein
MAKKSLFKIDPDSEVTGTGDGYVYVTCTPNHPGKKMSDHKKTYVYKHVALMELHLGRYLKEGEEVHHKDENPKNNALSNLELRSSEGHAKHHKFWKKSPRTKPGQKRKKMAFNIIYKFRERISI